VLDKVEVGTVQGLMDYLYKGQCTVKDRRGLKEMQDLVKMLGIKVNLENNPRKRSLNGEESSITLSEPNLEETVEDVVATNVDDALEEKEREITEDILKFVELFCESDKDQKCTRCDDWLGKDNFMEHFKTHKQQVQSGILSYKQTNKRFGLSFSESEVDKNDILINPNEVDIPVTNLLDILPAHLSKEMKQCLDKFERGITEVKCSVCDKVVTKEGVMQHFLNHNHKQAPSIKKEETKKRGRKPGGKNKKKEASVKNDEDVSNGIEKNESTEMKTSKRKGKRKIVEVADEESYTDEYTCFNPTFKIKPGVKKVGKSLLKRSADPSPSLAPSIPEIKLTFNLGDLGLTEETVKLQDLSMPLVTVDDEDDPKAKGQYNNHVSAIKKRKKVKNYENEPKINSIQFEDHRSSEEVSSEGSSTTLSLHSSKTNFPSFLRGVCSQAETLLPPGLDKEHQDLGRRVVHRLAGKMLVEESGMKVSRDDVMKEMIDGIDDEDGVGGSGKQENVSSENDDGGNLSGDDEDAPLVMDLSGQDL